MRLLFLTLFIFFLTNSVLIAQNDKLEAYFSFDDCKGLDDSGNGNSAAFGGGILCDCGMRDSSFHFDGDDDNIYIVGPFADIFTTSDFTVSFYIRPQEEPMQGPSQLVMAKQEACNTLNTFWVRYSPNTRTISSGISENDTLSVTVAHPLDKGPCWQLVTLTRANTRYSLYINGVLRDSKTSKARLDLDNMAFLKIGEPVCPLDEPFEGEIDEMRFHSKALDVDEINRYNLQADRILNNDTLIYESNSVQVTASARCAEQFLWSPVAGVSDPTIANPLITPPSPGIYSYILTIVHDNCQATDTIFVEVIDPNTLDCNVIFIPNAFTPGDSPGRNDVFGISNPFAVSNFISFEIFDRWGGRVFNAENAFDTWDGNFQGKPTNPGVFLYRLRYVCQGVEKAISGNLTLLR